MGEEETRIGVFVCDCGSNIAGVVDVPAVAEYARGLKHVVHAEEGGWICSVDYLRQLSEAVQEHSLNRVVVACCTPRTHEPVFKKTIKEAGLNPFLLEFVSIREQVSWVHMQEPEKATQKAKDLVRMGVAKAALLEEGEEIRLPVKTDCLVIGGGMAGMSAALRVAEQGFHAVIVEKAPELGGILNRLSSLRNEFETISAAEIVKETVDQVTSHPNIDVHVGTTIPSIEGYIGNYRVTLDQEGTQETVEVSTLIAASGMQETRPEDGQFCYGEDPRVLTQLELEERLKQDALGDDVQSVAFISCVNSKNDVRGCCNIGCGANLKNALEIKRRNPNARVYVFYREFNLVKEEKRFLEETIREGVMFVRFPNDRYPEVFPDNGRLRVRGRDILLGSDVETDADLVVLATAFVGDESVDQIKGLLKVSSNPDGFLQEAHVKLGPVDFPSDGLHLCGCARSPKGLKDTLDEANAAAMRASIPMNRGYIETEGIVADIDLTNCNNCGLCYKRCPYSAIHLDENKQPRVIKALCKGCGLCAADCPKECITIVHFTDDQILAQVEAALEENPEEKIIGFVCHWCALGGVDMAGVSRLQYPTNARLIRVMCSARVSVKMIERAFDLGAAGVLVAGCEFPTCHYITGNYAAEKRVKRTRKRLSKKGYDPDRLWNVWCSAADGPKFAQTMREMVKALNLD